MRSPTLNPMNLHFSSRRRFGDLRLLIGLLLLGAVVTAAVMRYSRGSAAPRPAKGVRLAYREKIPLDAGGFTAVLPALKPWPPSASLEEISHSFHRAGYRIIDQIDQNLAQEKRANPQKIVPLLMKAALFNY